ncbi:elongation factor P [bacterium]|nr:elongation factor P [bacterium]
MVTATQIRKGMIIEHKNDPHRVMDFKHITPGKGNAIVQVKLRNLRTGISLEQRYRSTEEVAKVRMDEKEMEYIYEEGGHYYFMDTQTYEQVPMAAEIIDDALNYLIPNLKIKIQYYKDEPISVLLPLTVDLKVIETEPSMRGATAASQTKPAKTETGFVVGVPAYIEEGTMIRVDTTTGKFIERA